MNEELKIIIKAVTDNAKKGIKEVSNEVSKLSKSGSDTSKSFSASMGKLGGAAKVAAGAVAAAVVAIGTALVSLSKSTQEYRTEQAKLLTAFQAAGAGATEAAAAYNGLYRFLGKSDVATEAAAHLA